MTERSQAATKAAAVPSEIPARSTPMFAATTANETDVACRSAAWSIYLG